MGIAEFCRASMNYVVAESNQHVGDGTTAVEVEIRDGRQSDLPIWQECGFQLMPLRAAVSDWNSDDEIQRVHYPEVEAWAKALTGCDVALVSSHIKRNPEEAARHVDLGPITFVHSDFADTYGPLIQSNFGATELSQRTLARHRLNAEDAKRARRLLILQFWRNVGPPRMDMPLAFCDARSLRSEELKKLPVVNYANGGFDFDTLGVLAPQSSRQHAWYVFPDMDLDEAVAFRTYDSEAVEKGQPFWTPHSAFFDPHVPPGRPARRSIELRATCLFM